MKYEMLEVEGISSERKSVMTRVLDAKLRASLNEKQMATLEANPDFFKRLTE
jgi:hypothetical protein